jgi:hypothetical protein
MSELLRFGYTHDLLDKDQKLHKPFSAGHVEAVKGQEQQAASLSVKNRKHKRLTHLSVCDKKNGKYSGAAG